MSSSINENYISIEDAALFLNIKPVTLRKWINLLKHSRTKSNVQFCSATTRLMAFSCV